MVVIEVVGGLLSLALACVTTYMAVFGGLGALGVVRYVRCPTCGHLTTVSQPGLPAQCAHCRHDVLLHPLHTLHDVHLWHRGTLVGTGSQRGVADSALHGRHRQD